MSQTAPRRFPRWLLWLIGAMVVLTLACVGAGAYGLMRLSTTSLFNEAQVDQLPAEKVELAAAIKLPPSARNLHSHYESFQDYFIRVRFEIDPADLPAFLASTAVGHSLSTTSIPSDFNEDIGQPWWQPRAAKRFQAGSAAVHTPKGYPDQQAVLIDMTDPQKYIVYVTAFDT